MRLFLDASALVKRYVVESGTDQVLHRLREADELLVSRLALPEVVSALNRRRREGRLTDEEYAACKELVRADTGNTAVIELSSDVVERAFACLESAPLRASDAVHVASALDCRADLFLTGDQRQYEAAKKMGLKAEFVGQQRGEDAS